MFIIERFVNVEVFRYFIMIFCFSFKFIRIFFLFTFGLILVFYLLKILILLVWRLEFKLLKKGEDKRFSDIGF